MTIDITVPQQDQSLGETQATINTNFIDFYSGFSVNHEEYNDPVERGKHKFLTMPDQASDPVTAINESALFSKKGVNPTESNLFFGAENAGNAYQLTRSVSTATTEFATNTNYSGSNYGGWTFLPGGLLLQYGRETSPGTGSTITFPLVFTNIPFSIILTKEGGTTSQPVNIIAGSVTTSDFDYVPNSTSSTAINWIAIGN